MAMARSLTDLLLLEETTTNEYISKFLPERLGVPLPVPYGGCAVGSAIHAACLTVPPDFHLYSALGHYLGPGSLDLKFSFTVERTRDTRTFASRRVQVSQTHASGKTRACLDVLIDFHLREKGGLTYSISPSGNYPSPESLPTNDEHISALLARGDINQEQAELHAGRFNPLGALMDIRQCPESVSGQNLYGLLKPHPTTQDHLPLHARTSSEWMRIKETLKSQAEHMAALAFTLDSGVSLLPLMHSDLRVDEVAAIASLDFALRVMQPIVDTNSWHMHERSTSSGAGAIIYGESRLYDREGVLVASMSQQSILRLWKDQKPSL